MKVEMTQQEWQAVLTVLARSPFNEVAQLIQKIAEQLQEPRVPDTPHPIPGDRPHFKEVTNG